jgi:hypothetical protein
MLYSKEEHNLETGCDAGYFLFSVIKKTLEQKKPPVLSSHTESGGF